MQSPKRLQHRNKLGLCCNIIGTGRRLRAEEFGFPFKLLTAKGEVLVVLFMPPTVSFQFGGIAYPSGLIIICFGSGVGIVSDSVLLNSVASKSLVQTTLHPTC